MARRIRRRKMVSRSARTRKVETVRSETKLPEAKPISATRVLIAAPGPMRTILTSKISGSTEVMLAGVAEDDMTTVEKVLTEEADVVAIYIHLGSELAGLDIARNVSKASPQAGILIMVNDLAGIDVRRHSRRFGVSWSYAVAENVASDTRFIDLVQSVGRGIHWIDPELKRILEAIWQIAEQGRDLEGSAKSQKDSLSPGSSGPTAKPGLNSDEPKPRGVQTMQAGKSGAGKKEFMVGSPSEDLLDDDDDEFDDEDYDQDLPKPRGIQTMQTGRGGIGSDGFGVSKAG